MSIEIYKVVRDTIEPLQKDYSLEQLRKLFGKMFRNNLLHADFATLKMSNSDQNTVRKIQQYYQKHKDPKIVKEVIDEVLITEIAVVGQNAPDLEKIRLIVQVGSYRFGDKERVKVLKGHGGSKIEMGKGSHLVIEPNAHDLEINLGENATVILQQGVYRCHLFPQGRADVTLGRLAHANMVSSALNVTIDEDPEAYDNSY